MTRRIAATPTLQTQRLVLRGVKPSDAQAIAEGSGDSRVAHFLTDVPTPYPVALAAQWAMRRMERGANGQGPTLAITLSAQPNVAIGTVSLRIHKRDSRAELGYWLAASCWGQGLATEANRALIHWGFEMGLAKIYARTMFDNLGSIRVLQKLGMQQEGVLRRHIRRGQALVDVLEFGIFSEDWQRS
jgi:[ribosomal protein S5]-alanine N-acetyltransferase